MLGGGARRSSVNKKRRGKLATPRKRMKSVSRYDFFSFSNPAMNAFGPPGI